MNVTIDKETYQVSKKRYCNTKIIQSIKFEFRVAEVNFNVPKNVSKMRFGPFGFIHNPDCVGAPTS